MLGFLQDSEHAQLLAIFGGVLLLLGLIGGGLDAVLSDFANLPNDAQLRLAAEIKLLTLPAEMGENFKCLGLARNVECKPTGLVAMDRTMTL